MDLQRLSEFGMTPEKQERLHWKWWPMVGAVAYGVAVTSGVAGVGEMAAYVFLMILGPLAVEAAEGQA